MTKISPARAAPQAHPQYTLAKRLDLKRYSTVVIWCRAFGVAFTSAPLSAS